MKDLIDMIDRPCCFANDSGEIIHANAAFRERFPPFDQLSDLLSIEHTSIISNQTDKTYSFQTNLGDVHVCSAKIFGVKGKVIIFQDIAENSQLPISRILKAAIASPCAGELPLSAQLANDLREVVSASTVMIYDKDGNQFSSSTEDGPGPVEREAYWKTAKDLPLPKNQVVIQEITNGSATRTWMLAKRPVYDDVGQTTLVAIYRYTPPGKQVLSVLESCSELVNTALYQRSSVRPQSSEAQEHTIELLENYPEGVAVVNESGELVFSNTKFRITTRRPNLNEQGVIDFSAIIANEDRDRFKHEISAVLEKSEMWRGQLKLLTNDRQRLPLQVSIGQIGHGQLLLTLKDESELGHIKQKLASANQLATYYKYALDKASMTALIDSHGSILHLNQSFTEAWQHHKSDILGLKLEDLIFGQEYLDNYKEMEDRLNKNRVWKGELAFYHRSGRPLYCEVTGIPLGQNKGQSGQSILIAQDISDRKYYELTMETTLSRLTVILSSIPSGILVEDRDRSVVLMNDRLKHLFGLDRDVDYSGKQINEIDHDICQQQDMGELLSEMETISKNAQPQIAEECHIFDKIFLRDFIPVFNGGKFIGNFWQFRDVTHSKRIEQDLITARNQAIQASKAKSSFLSNMSHEIRTPLNSILGIADLLSDTGLNEEQREYVKIFQSSGEKLLLIINDILDLSKIEAGKLLINQGNFNLYDLMVEEIRIWNYTARQKNIDFSYSIELDAFEEIESDRVRINQVLINLLGNACKFTPEGGHIHFECEQTSGDEYRFTISDTGEGIDKEHLDLIFDPFVQADSSEGKQYQGTGLGLAISKRLVELLGGKITATSSPGKGSSFSFTIQAQTRDCAPENLRNLVVSPNIAGHYGMTGFKKYLIGQERPFEEVNRPPYPAVGLSLSEFAALEDNSLHENAHDRVTILLENNDFYDTKKLPDQVSCLRMPLTVEEYLGSVAPLKVKASVQDLPIDQIPSDVQQILLADDVMENRFIIKKYLQDYDIEIVEAEDGLAALDRFKSSSFQLVLMDIQMPEMDGLECIEHIREFEREQNCPPTPIIALTGYSMKEHREKALAAGANLHVPKPVSKRNLIDAIRKLTNGQASTDLVAHEVANMPKEFTAHVPSSLSEILPTYMENRTKDLQELTQALKIKDFQIISQIGHKLAGHARGYGFAHLTEIGEQLEEQAEKENLAALVEITKEYARKLEATEVVIVDDSEAA